MIIKRSIGKKNIDYGMKDYYKYYSNQSKAPISNLKFNNIVSTFNSKIVDMIINDGLEFTPKTLQFTFCVRKTKRLAKIKDDKLINTSPIDWKSTKDLWEKSKEASDKKILLRYLNNHTSKYVFRIKALMENKPYKNKKLYRFKACRSFQRNLAKRILDENQDNFEAYKLY